MKKTIFLLLTGWVTLHPGLLPPESCKVDRVGTLARYIAKREGFFVRGTLPWRMNNPGSLVYVGQLHAQRGDRGFARFNTPQDGWMALEKDLRRKLLRGVRLNRAWEYL